MRLLREGSAVTNCTAFDPQKQYRCAQCGEVFEFGWTEEEAKAEMVTNGWSDTPPETMAIVCDDCYNIVMAPDSYTTKREER
jgi:DNA-directed RNA polymerase subunit RPC12/RpoP